MTQTEASPGKTVSFEAGDTIYQQGARGEGVYMLLEGQVDIWRMEGEEAHHIATLNGGELLGEVSVIENTNHSVTAKASRLTKALFIDALAFRKSFADPLVRHVVNTLAARLRSSYSAATKQADTAKKQVHFKSKFPILEGSSRTVASKLLTFVELKEFPFIVGKMKAIEGMAQVDSTHLRLPLPAETELTENHFEIIKREGRLLVRDLGSPAGTIVNGEKLSKYGIEATAKLHAGKNTVVAGGPESPVRFIVAVPE